MLKLKVLLDGVTIFERDYPSQEEKKDHSYILHFSFDLEREKTMIDIIKILRGIKILELEPENMEKIKDSEDIELYKVNQYTDLITYSKEKRIIIEPAQELDKFVNIEDKIIINVYEVLNSRGMKKIFDEKNSINYDLDLYSFISLKDKPKNIDCIRNKLNIEFSKQEKNNNNNNNQKNITTINTTNINIINVNSFNTVPPENNKLNPNQSINFEKE